MSLFVAMAISELQHKPWHSHSENFCDQGDLLVKVVQTVSTTASFFSAITIQPSKVEGSSELSQECLEFFNLFEKWDSTASKNLSDLILKAKSPKTDLLELNIKKSEIQVLVPIEESHLEIETEAPVAIKKDQTETQLPARIEESPLYTENQIVITYNDRDVLDLGSNIGGAWNFTPAVLPKDVSGYFENRSQISWIKGGRPPCHLMRRCRNGFCDFKEPIYY